MAKKQYKYLDIINEHIEKNKTLWFFSLFLLLLNMILIMGYFSLRSNQIIVVELPKTSLVNGGKVMIGEEKSNSLYYKVWGRYIVNEIGNYSPADIHQKLVKLTTYMDSSLFSKYKKAFAKYEKNIVDNVIHEKFVLQKDTVSNKGNKALYIATGLAIKDIGNGLKKEYYTCNYNIGFKIYNFRLLITSYKKDCKPIAKEVFDKEKAMQMDIKIENNKDKK